MNKRVKEIMIQVCEELGLPFTIEHNSAYMLDNFSEKFSELIVKECAHIAWLNSTEDNVSHAIIKEHFGVE